VPSSRLHTYTAIRTYVACNTNTHAQEALLLRPEEVSLFSRRALNRQPVA